MHGVVVVGPKPFVSRHVDDREAAGTQAAGEFCKCVCRSFDLAEDVETDDRIIAGCGERESGNRTFMD